MLIQVKDEGCGIRQEDLDKIFDPFFTTKETGTGLGLSVVHQIVEQHGGLLTVENNPDRGVTFSILLPVRPEGPHESRGMLFADDDESLRRVMQMELEELGYNVVTAADGESALRLLGETRPALVISDLKMPGSRVWTCCGKSAPITRRSP